MIYRQLGFFIAGALLLCGLSVHRVGGQGTADLGKVLVPRNIIPITGGDVSGRISGKVLAGGADYQNLSPPATIDARYLWQTNDGEIIIVRNGSGFGSLVPAFEVRTDGPYAWLNAGFYLSSNPGPATGGVGITMYESTR